MKIAATNAFIFHKFYRIEVGKKETTESHFWDQLVLQIIEKYGLPLLSVVVPASMQHRVSHGSKSLSVQQRSWCAICVQNKNWKCPDCSFTPALCESSGNDCHGLRHTTAYDSHRKVVHSQKSQDWTIQMPFRETQGSKCKRKQQSY